MEAPLLSNHIFKTDAAVGKRRRSGAIVDRHEPHPAAHDHQKRSHLRIVPCLTKGTRAWYRRYSPLERATHRRPRNGRSHDPSQAVATPDGAAIKNLDHDWSQIVDKEGNQVATVGHHFQLSRAFNKSELEQMSREGTCLACHKEIPANSAAINLLHHVAKYTGQLPKTADQHNWLLHKITLLAAWTQVIVPFASHPWRHLVGVAKADASVQRRHSDFRDSFQSVSRQSKQQLFMTFQFSNQE